MTRASLVATTALLTALVALAVSVWAASQAAETRDEIRHLGEILSAGASPHRMSMDRPPPPQLDPE